ncbi:protein phosphatase 2C domain-containing protein [Chelativorans sp. EGI FJ00035]|uniref:Protein phosphatase 2C domain-containing protein n=2 Tax=Chelativorans salis TaxID=2978478 RepID=A0ABT2LIB6_9HYPH|nr:protein phosphatase 2C domain-containing protein [Chelativorans sp. EGI FJ00035]
MSKAGFANTVSLTFESFGLSHRGRVRQINEDGFLMDPASGVWLVADGMGGHDAGEVASASIVEQMSGLTAVHSAPELLAQFEDRIARAHSKIRRLSTARGGVTIGSTVAALLAFDGRYACLWSGDSRIYLVRDGAITQVSRDHSEVQELLDRGMIDPAEAQSWPRRNVITRAIGVTEDVEIDAMQSETLPGDVFVLNTDGLTAHVSDEEIREAVTGHSAQQSCEHLLELVLSRGATDNVTVVIVKVHEAETTRRGTNGPF